MLWLQVEKRGECGKGSECGGCCSNLARDDTNSDESGHGGGGRRGWEHME